MKTDNSTMKAHEEEKAQRQKLWYHEEKYNLISLNQILGNNPVYKYIECDLI